MLGADTRASLSLNVQQLLRSFHTSLSNDDIPLPSTKVVETTSPEELVEYLHSCWLNPTLSGHVVVTCTSLVKVFVTRPYTPEQVHQYVYALGESVAHCNIALYCYTYLTQHCEALLTAGLKEKTQGGHREEDLILVIRGVTRIVEAVQQCGKLLDKTQLYQLQNSTNTTVARLADHLQAVCSGLNDDVFDGVQLAAHQIVSKVPRLSEEQPGRYCPYSLQYPLFTTGDNVLHICQKKAAQKPIVYTDNISTVIAKLGLAFESRTPVLLEGQIGAGKTLLLEHFASLFGLQESDVLSVQVDEQTDSKVLVGNYVCSEVPGQYVWQPGILTRAATAGKWVVFEDIDHAPSDIISLIKSVVETNRIQTPLSLLPTHPNFTVFLTQRVTEQGRSYRYNPVLGMLENTFTRLRLHSYDDSQLKQVLGGKFPTLRGCAGRLVELYRSMEHGSLRQLIKWATRVQGHLTHNLTVVTKEVFLEAIDCFCSWQPSQEKRVETAYKIGTFLSMPKAKVESYLTSYRATVTLSATHYSVGRATVRCVSAPRPAALFAHTRHSLNLLEKLACAVFNNEPVLLTGETGNGKTASVQHLSEKTGNKLVVINMSQQSDTSDLIGGFKPLDVLQLMKPLYESFDLLFKESFSVSKNAGFLQKVQVCWRKKDWSTLLQAMLHIGKKMMDNKPWSRLYWQADKIHRQINQIENSFAFAFVEGSLVQAVKSGDWILLDEINLAPPELLESLNCILDDTGFTVIESGDMELVKKHPNFRLFAAMNPSTDVGKKDLPVGIKNRFTEIYVDELTEETDLKILAATYLHRLNLPSAMLTKIVSLYTELRRLAADVLTDGRGHKPCFSLRTLCRAFKYAGANPCGHVLRSLYEGFSLSFLTQLDRASYPVVRRVIVSFLLPANTASDIVRHPLPQPGTGYVQVEGYWVKSGSEVPVTDPDYIMTPTVRENLRDLSRAVSSGQYPVLLQGPTSAGKTSVVKYLAGLAGTPVIRINNHEHTDLQEYVGSYCVGANDKLVFKEGLLVEAMRQGYWLILDELNLAPTDVLEALNRVLDDNRELFIAETQTTVRAHAHFMLFATQNPAGSYGGRKMLSRAFRNRFIELHYEDLPLQEIRTIIEKRCQLPCSYSKKIVSVMEKLQSSRTKSGIFAGRHALITLRDLFRWSDRYRNSPGEDRDWDQQLVNDGYMLLSGKVRREEESAVIKSVLESIFKRTVNLNNFYDGSLITLDYKSLTGFEEIVWTPSMMRLLTLVSRSLAFKEPVLLVGETGCGKTTICQVLSVLTAAKLHILNCHMHSDTADFIGSLRPVRDQAEDKLFEWVDGPLVQAMREGDMILLDEISLADDSVLERLNSVLEPERQLTLAESSNSATITAHQDFRILATMNPGGDYGKKELSPALRNRFTEVWCGGGDEAAEMRAIALHNLLSPAKERIADMIIQFVGWFSELPGAARYVITVRDILTWVSYHNRTSYSTSSDMERYQQAAHLVLVDGFSDKELKQRATRFLAKQCGQTMELGYSVRVEQDAMFFGTLKMERGPLEFGDVGLYSFEAPTTASNTFRIIRGLQVDKPILLEGHPGVGKTSITSAIARLLGYRLTRINLSEQTDMSDLFGSDLPNDGGSGFSWRDGPLLQALKKGNWVLLDEMNLASQAVLEGLNACLDHRGEVYIPELSKSFNVGTGASKTRFIACMNPVDQGGGRKGLPKSFLNRFVKVHIERLSPSDMMAVLSATHPRIEQQILDNIISFNCTVHQQVCVRGEWGQSGSPWEFNLRDTRRWCELIAAYPNLLPAYFIDTIYTAKFRSQLDKQKVRDLQAQVFGREPELVHLFMAPDRVQIGPTVLARRSASSPTAALAFKPQLQAMEILAQSVNMNWMSILVGGRGSGKSTTVKTLAALCGQELLEIGCSSVFDTSDLLGGFTQVSESSHYSLAQDLVSELTKALLATRPCPEALLEACHAASQGPEATQRLIQTLNNTEAVSEKVQLIGKKIEDLISKVVKKSYGLFEWRNSPFVDALAEGRWVVLDDANLVSPSVLDRLNPLLEKEGELLVDERGYVDNKPCIIRPHANFRLFLTMDAKYGELSRPMRNRGIEIFMDEEYAAVDSSPLCPENSATFGIQLYGQTLRDCSARQDYAEDVFLTVLSYLPPTSWQLLASTSGCSNINSRIKEYLNNTESIWKPFDGLQCSDPHLNPRLEMDPSARDVARLWYNGFIATIRLRSNPGYRNKMLTTLGSDLRDVLWDDSLILKKYIVLYNMFCQAPCPTLWWELRAPISETLTCTLYDGRYGQQCDDKHWKLVESFGHPPLTANEEEGKLIDDYLRDTNPLDCDDAQLLSKMFGIESSLIHAKKSYLGSKNIALFLIPTLLNLESVTSEDRACILGGVLPHLSGFLQFSLSAYQSNQSYLSDVLAALAVQHQQAPLNLCVFERSDLSELLSPPSCAGYDEWAVSLKELLAHTILASLLRGSDILMTNTETLQGVALSRQNCSTASNESKVAKLLSLAREACTLSSQDPVEHHDTLLTAAASYMRVLEEYRAMHGAIQRACQGSPTILETVYPIRDIDALVQSEQAGLERLAEKRGYRPTKAGYGELATELRIFNQVVCQKAGRLPPGRPEAAESWLASSASFMRRCYAKYWHYRDQLAPITTVLYSLSQELIAGSTTTQRGFQLFTAVPEIEQAVKQRLQAEESGDKLKLMDILVTLFNYKKGIATPRGDLDVYLVKAFYLLWSRNDALKMKQEEAKDSIYKDTERYQDEDDTEALEDLFPCFNDFADMEADPQEPEHSEKIKDDVIEPETLNLHIKQLVTMFSGKQDEPQTWLRKCLSLHFDLSVVHDGALRAGKSWEVLDRFTCSPSSTDQLMDIYRGAYPREVLQIQGLLLNLQLRVAGLLDSWPEHPALVQIASVVERIQTFAIDQPLNKFLLGLEILLGKCQLWEEIASRAVSLSELVAEITQHIIRWRAAELKSWPLLLEVTRQRHIDLGGPHFLKLANLLLDQPASPSYTEFISTIMVYVEAATMGEYEARLQYLKLCTQHLGHYISCDVRRIVDVLYFYYGLLSDTVEKELTKESADIKKQLQEYTKIVKWKDVNYFSIKLATENSHHKLLKFIKKYEACLKRDVSRVTDSYPPIKLPPPACPADIATDNTQLSSDARSEMAITLRQAIESGVQQLGSMTTSTAAIQEKDNRLKAFKSLDLRKRKALSELFKCLTYCGLSYTKGLSTYFSVDYFYAAVSKSAPCREGAWSLYNLKTLLNLTTVPSEQLRSWELDRIKGYSGHLFCMIDETLLLRKNARDTNSQVQHILRNISGVELCKAQISTKTKAKLILHKISLLTDCYTQTQYLADAVRGCDYKNTTFGALFGPEGLIDETAMGDLASHVTTLKESVSQLRNITQPLHLASTHDGAMVCNCETLVGRCLVLMEALATKPHAVCRGIPARFTLFAKLGEFVGQIREAGGVEAAEGGEELTVQQLNALVAAVTIPPFVAEPLSAADSWDVEKGLFAARQRELQATAAVAAVHSALTLAERIIRALPRLLDAKAPVGKALSRLAFVLRDISAFCERYTALLEQWLDTGLLPVASTLFVLFQDIVKRGYCKPEELEEAEREGGEMWDNSEGGGVGEGEGTTDVSSQIDNQEQVEGTQNEEKEDQDDVKEEKDGVEMEDDFEGALGDVEKEEGEEGDEEGEESGEENDEQMGDVDDSEEKQKTETFGDSEEKLPDTEAEAETGAQSEKQEELSAKNQELEDESGKTAEEQQALEEEGGEEEYASEDDIPNPEAPGQQLQDIDEEMSELPEDLENMDTAEPGNDEENGAEEEDGDEGEEEDGQQDDGEETGEVADQNEEAEEMEDEENVGASLPTHHTDPAQDTQADTQSTQETGGDPGSQEEAGEGGEHQEPGQMEDPAGNLAKPKEAEESEPRNEAKRERDSAQQLSDKVSAKRLKPQPKSQDIESNKVEVRDTDVFEHTEEGEDYDREAVDTALGDKTEGCLDIEEEAMVEEYEEEKKEKEVEPAGKKEGSTKTEKQGSQEEETEEEDSKMAPDSEEMEVEVLDSRASYHATDATYDTVHREPGCLRAGLMELSLTAGAGDQAEAVERWSRYEALTAHLAQELCEELRLILEPTKSAKLQGDFRTGKRLNMKRIIPYIASRFQKDKIWLRRTRPSNRDYQVMIALDDSASMANAHCVQMSLEAVAVICGAMSKLEVGRLGVCGFGGVPSLVVPFSEPFTRAAGAKIIRHFTFQDDSTDVVRLLETTRAHFAETASLQSNKPISQLLFIVSDGRGLFIKGVEAVKKAVKQVWDAGVFVVFLIIDKQNKKDSILDIRTPVFDGTGKLVRIESYLDTFPFPYYVVLRTPEELPGTLADALRQWIEMVAGS